MKRAFCLGTLAAALLWTGAASANEGVWSRPDYGPQDRLGAVNNLSPEGALAAAQLVKLGKVYSLAVVTGAATPTFPGRTYSAERIPAPGTEPPAADDALTAYDEKVVSSMGIGTQMDGLGHVGIGHTYYNGVKALELNTAEGFGLDLAHVPPIVTRGVLIDMARHHGVEEMKAGQLIDRAGLQAAMAAQGVTVRKGDVVLLHTGYAAMAERDPKAFIEGEPGLTEDGAAWLADQGVVAIGADVAALEALPSPDPKGPFRVHALLLSTKGVHILENVQTAELAKDRATEFLFVLAPPRMEGTVQMIVHPVAIR